MERAEAIARPVHNSALFGGALFLFCVAAAIAVGSFPLQASIVTIFLFAGVHNFMEFRYFLARMPVRWGNSRNYYLFGITGTLALTVSYLTIYFGAGNWLWSLTDLTFIVAVWNTGFVLWVAAMFYMRGKQRPGSDWGLAFPVAFMVIAFVWMIPHYWSLSLVYIHPLIALWFLDRQIRRTRPEWHRTYRMMLPGIPVLLLVLWGLLASRPDLSEETNLFWRITQHAGGEILPGISTHFLVAAHVFLESIHYLVWILLIPVVDRRAVPWKIKSIPAFTSRKGFPKLVVAGLALSCVLVIALWVGFAVDYTTARDIYFAFAVAHVMAEFPFLIKML